jgi:glutamate racemase
MPVIRKFVPEGIQLLEQGKVVSSKLMEYLARHPEMDSRCSKSGLVKYYTTENIEVFEKNATIFIGHEINGTKIVFK